jgi:hypothetical protein
VLLDGAGLMIRSFSELGRADPGFDTHHLLTLAYRVPRNKYPTAVQQSQFHREVAAKIKTSPGVLAATSVRAVPFTFLDAENIDLPSQTRRWSCMPFMSVGKSDRIGRPWIYRRVWNPVIADVFREP